MGNTHETKENLNTKNLNTENLNDNAVLDQTQFLNGIASVYGKYLCKDKESAIYKYYAENSRLHPVFYLFGNICALIILLHQTLPNFQDPELIVSDDIGGTVDSIAMDVASKGH